MDFVAPDYAAALERFVHQYAGSRHSAVRWAPAIFQFYARLFSGGHLSHDARAIVTSVLAYFVVPDDLMPEAELGPVGLLDDLYVASHAYRILRRELPREVIAEAWVEETPLEAVMSEVYSQARGELGRRGRDALRLAGLT